MRINFYEDLKQKTKAIGIINLVNKVILSEKEAGEDTSSYLDLPFYYKIRKNTFKKGKVNAEIISLDGRKKYYALVSRNERKGLYLMHTQHWYYDNHFTRFLIKNGKRLNQITFFSFLGITIFKLVKSVIALFVLLKACE